MGLVDDYLSAYKVGKKEQMAARMALSAGLRLPPGRQ